jgi:uncharacterized membrane protein YoaK (UPF0700 family)
MISKLPRWAWWGSALLAGIAGMINAVGFLSFQHQGVTHLTGSTTLLGIAVAQGDLTASRQVLAVTGFFLAGCILSGMVVRDSTLQLGRRYGAALAVESILLFCAVPFLGQNNPLGACLASCACGLQNGMVSTYSGAVLRTTHLSGLFTDLGIFIGHLLRRVAVDWRRARLCAVLIGAFFAGALAGAATYPVLGYGTLYLPAALTGGVGLLYTIYLHRRRVPA